MPGENLIIGIEYVLPERRKTAVAIRADFWEKSLKVFAHHSNDFVVGHGGKVAALQCGA